MMTCLRMHHLTGIMFGKEFAVYAAKAISIPYYTGKSNLIYKFWYRFLRPQHFCYHIIIDVDTCAHAQNAPLRWFMVEGSVRCVVHQ